VHHSGKRNGHLKALIEVEKGLEASFTRLFQFGRYRHRTVEWATSWYSNRIEYSRGTLEVLDRKALEKVACPCYRLIKREYERLLKS
jgi:hypothetical protein